MKKNAAWALLFIYLNAAAQPLLPWVSDVVAHVFNWQDHLKHVHKGHVHSHHVGLSMAELEKDHEDHPVTTHHFFYAKDKLSAHLLLNTVVLRDAPFPTWSSLSPSWFFDYKNVIGEVQLPPPDVPLSGVFA